MTNTTEMIFGAIDSDKSISVELKHDDKLAVESNTYIQVNNFARICLRAKSSLILQFQAALLYTSISGQRRLRILTLALTVTSSYTSLYPACDLDAITNYITKVGKFDSKNPTISTNSTRFFPLLIPSGIERCIFSEISKNIFGRVLSELLNRQNRLNISICLIFLFQRFVRSRFQHRKVFVTISSTKQRICWLVIVKIVHKQRQLDN